jgi:ankyrin repeat protein
LFAVKCLLSIFAVLVSLLSVYEAQPKHRNQTTRQRINSEFIYAIEKGDLATFYSLLKRGANINARRENRTTALMVAANNSQTEFVVALISRGARVNSRNAFGNTALMNAAGSGQVEMVHWLLTAGANVDAKNESGWTALALATKSAYAQQPNYQRVIELLTAAKNKKPHHRAGPNKRLQLTRATMSLKYVE